jgi:Flp pilus assembly protein TadG
VKRRTIRTRRRDRGATAVEMAIVLPVLLMIVFGVIDFGRMYNAQVTLTEAAREGARVRALGAATRTADTQAKVNVVVDGMTVSTASTGCGSGEPTDATVTVTYNFTFVTPFAAIAGMFGSKPGGGMTLTGKGVMGCVN